VNSLVPAIAAGSTFAAATLAGMVVGLLAARATGQGLWVLGGLFAGMALGGYSAVRLLLRSMG
jgi:hypothetical protein